MLQPAMPPPTITTRAWSFIGLPVSRTKIADDRLILPAQASTVNAAERECGGLLGDPAEGPMLRWLATVRRPVARFPRTDSTAAACASTTSCGFDGARHAHQVG